MRSGPANRAPAGRPRSTSNAGRNSRQIGFPPILVHARRSAICFVGRVAFLGGAVVFRGQWRRACGAENRSAEHETLSPWIIRVAHRITKLTEIASNPDVTAIPIWKNRIAFRETGLSGSAKRAAATDDLQERRRGDFWGGYGLPSPGKLASSQREPEPIVRVKRIVSRGAAAGRRPTVGTTAGEQGHEKQQEPNGRCGNHLTKPLGRSDPR